MKKTMNQAQRDYMMAKARVEALEDQKEQMEQAYIAAHGIVNPDGSVPGRIFCIMDEAAFEKANEESAAEMTACGLEAEYNNAEAMLRAAEDRLIEYGLSVVLAGVRATLEGGAKGNYAVRQKMIELTLRLDVSTVPRQAEPGTKAGNGLPPQTGPDGPEGKDGK